jgi:RNA polymerase sigma factor (sigma-70 family)
MTDRTQHLRENTTSQRRWAQWYKIIYPKVYSAAFRLSNGDAEAARDLTQEALVRFLDYRAIERVTDDRHAVSFLIKTCRNLAIDRNARAHEIPLSELGAAEGIETSEEPVEPTLDLEKMLGSLPAQDQELMHWVRQGLSVAEIARRTGNSYTAIGVRLHRIRKALRESFGSL